MLNPNDLSHVRSYAHLLFPKRIYFAGGCQCFGPIANIGRRKTEAKRFDIDVLFLIYLNNATPPYSDLIVNR